MGNAWSGTGRKKGSARDGGAVGAARIFENVAPVAIPIDAEAELALRARHLDAVSAPHCELCEVALTAERQVEGSGLFVWARGEDARYEEPPLCDSCAVSIGVTANRLFAIDDDEGE